MCDKKKEYSSRAQSKLKAKSKAKRADRLFRAKEIMKIIIIIQGQQMPKNNTNTSPQTSSHEAAYEHETTATNYFQKHSIPLRREYDEAST